MERIPEDGPVLLVGNHSGGNITPDTIVFTLAFNTYFGVERPFHQLAHNLVLDLSGRALPAAFGTVAASPRERAQGARRRRRGARLPGRRLGGAPAELAVEPGRLRRPQGLHPAGARRGGADRAGGLGRAARRPRSSSATGERLSKLLRLDKLFRLKVLPVNLSLPWIVNVGDFLGHLPLPAKITVQVHGADRPARALRARPGPRRDLRATSPG